MTDRYRETKIGDLIICEDTQIPDHDPETERLVVSIEGVLPGDWIAHYHRQHAACPQCGAVDNEQTCVGYIPIPGHEDEYQDRNRVRCECGWVGIVHDLVPEKTP